jgi:UDP-3-O-[3-hydroxymyristoyl] glucosamine N-acyltransferase
MPANMHIRLDDILPLLGPEPVITGSREAGFTNLRPPQAAGIESLVWQSVQPADIHAFTRNSPARLFLFPLPAPQGVEPPEGKTIVYVSDPRLASISILARFFRQRPVWGIHPAVVVHPEAVIHPETYIGPNTFIGRCTIGRGSILYGNNHLYDGVRLGEDVIIHAGTVIGADGFGYHPGPDKEWLKFEHQGGVIIGNGVEIGANTCIDRGALGDTTIGDGTKIDNLVHIAHNVQVGRHCLIIAHAMIGGSCVIGDHAWIAPHAAIMQKTQIGHDATAGLGAVVLTNIPAGETWAGLPARKLEKNKAELPR